MNDTEIQKALSDAYDVATPQVQEYVRSKKLQGVVGKLQLKLKLDDSVTDQVGYELLMMLLGMSEPEELITNLGAIDGLNEPAITEIASAVTTEIFPQFPSPAPEPEEAKAVVPIKKVTPPAGAVVKKPTLRPSMLPSVKEGALTRILPALPPTPTVRTMRSDVESAKITKPVPPPQAKPVLPTITKPPVPAVLTFTPAKPAAPVVPSITTAPKPTVPVQPTTPKPAASASESQKLDDSLKQYGVDPYREVPE